jgi:hypothetical protein
VRVSDCQAVTVLDLRGARRSVAERLDHLGDSVRQILAPLGATLVCIAIEEPRDYFEEDRHDTAFVLGRAFQHLWLVSTQLAGTCYAISPADASLAVSCSRSAPKAARNRACATMLGVEQWDGKRGRWQGAIVRADGLDGYAVACAGVACHRQSLLRAMAAA